MNPFEDLSQDNHDQIRKYLRFFRQKKDGILREIDREFIDIRNDKIEETMFTKDDMLEYSDFIASAIKVLLLGHKCFIDNPVKMNALHLLDFAIVARGSRHWCHHQHGSPCCQSVADQLSGERRGTCAGNRSSGEPGASPDQQLHLTDVA
jgi:hypothetical protein